MKKKKILTYIGLCLLALLAASGCWGFAIVPKAEICKDKEESNQEYNINVDIAGASATQTKEALNATLGPVFESKNIAAKLKTEKQEAQFLMQEENRWAEKWKDRFMYTIIVLIVILILAPTWLIVRFRNWSKQIKEAWERVKENDQHLENVHASVDYGMSQAGLTEEIKSKMKSAMVQIQGSETVNKIRNIKKGIKTSKG